VTKVDRKSLEEWFNYIPVMETKAMLIDISKYVFQNSIVIAFDGHKKGLFERRPQSLSYAPL